MCANDSGSALGATRADVLVRSEAQSTNDDDRDCRVITVGETDDSPDGEHDSDEDSDDLEENSHWSEPF